jgi:glycerophosphoryl diester phosphodiesterase
MSNIIGHKGYPSTAHENSKEAIQNAVNSPFLDGIEFDVKITKDKKLILLHNSTLNNISKKKGFISKKSYTDLIGNDMVWHPDYLKYYLSKITSYGFKDGKIIRKKLKEMKKFVVSIATFDDVIDILKGYTKKIIIDLKIKKYDKEIKELLIKNIKKIKCPNIYI